MLAWLIRGLFILAGSLTSFFISRDALKFDIIQMIVAVILFTLLVILIAFWPALIGWYKRVFKQNRPR